MLPLDPLLDRVRPLLAAHDQPAYLVGGVVRDALLGRANHDIDLIVPGDAIPLAFRLARALGLPAYRLDEERDVGRIVVPGGSTTLDIARFRGATLADDLGARDFTINALALPVAARAAEEVIDLHDGRADLAAGRLQIIHATSIADDPVRALRAARFTVQLGFRPTEETIAAARAAAPELPGRVSPERVRDELNRLLATPAPEQAVALLEEWGLLGPVLPEIAALAGVAQSPPHHEAVLPHTLSVLRALVAIERWLDGTRVAAAWTPAVARTLAAHRPALIAHLDAPIDGGLYARQLLRWSALFHDSGKPATQTRDDDGRLRFLGHDEAGARLTSARLNHFRFSAEAVRRARDTVAGHMRPLHLALDGRPPSRRAIYRYYRALREAGVDVVLLSLADHLATYDGPGPEDSWAALLAVATALLDAYFTAYHETVAPARLLNGQEIMALLDIGPGPQLGQLLAALEEAQAAGEVTTRAEATAFLESRFGGQ